MGRVSFFGIGIALAVLVISKVILSGVYLHSGKVTFTTPTLAMAESAKPADKPVEPAAAPEPPNSETLDRRVQALKAREIEVQKREENLLPLKNEIDEKLAELNELQLRLTAFAKKLADREKAMEDSKVSHLVELYAAMEPAKAAMIMEKLKVPTVVLILRNMKGKSAGQILAMMKPERGAIISEKLSQFE